MPPSNHSITRRDALALAAVCMTALPTAECAQNESNLTDDGDHSQRSTDIKTSKDTNRELTMQIHYLEVVTKDVDAACQLHSALHNAKFGDADPSLGGARTAQLSAGGKMGIRAPMHEGEKPVTRAYMLVKDIEAAVSAAEKSGAKIAVPPMKIPGHGTCAVYFQDGIEAGLWQI